jgi:glutamyl-tRNA reductase
MPSLLLVGTSHNHAPVELREQLALDPEAAGALAGRLAAALGEAVALSTCNRVCLYLVTDDVDAGRERVVAELSAVSGLASKALQPSLYVKEDEEAARHLFRVASGLDSLVPGEAEILGQVRSAYESSSAAAGPGPVLHRLFRQALHVGKRVRRETSIGENPASVSSAAAELASRVFDDLDRRSVLLIGAGKMGELAARNLASRGVSRLCVANRSVARASELADRLGAEAVGLDAVPEELGRTDVVISATGSSGLVVTADTVGRALRVRRGRPIFFVDIAVPRDLDPAINDLDGCYLFDVDDLERVVQESLAGRLDEAERAEAIAAAEAAEFRAWQLSREVVPAIAQLRRRGEEIRRAELERARSRLEHLSPSERRAVELLTAGIVAKLLHVPTVRLKSAAAAPGGAAYAETVRELFGLPRQDDG